MIYFARWKIALIFLVIALGVAYTIPNFFSRESLSGAPSWLPNNQINLGLDLQGGAHLAFQVETSAVVEERLAALEDEVRNALRGERGQRIRYSGLRAARDKLTVRIRESGDMDEALRRVRDLAQPVGSATGFAAAQNIEVSSNADGIITVTMTDAAIEEIRNSAVRQSIEIIRLRIDELGTREPTIQREGAERIIVQVPGEDNPQRIIDIVGRTAKMTFHEHDTSVPVEEAEEGRIPPGSILAEFSDEEDRQFEPKILLKRTPVVSGEHLTDAQPSFDQRTNEPVVAFRFNAAGSRRFGDYTRKNVGRRFAIMLDGKVLTAPVIQDAILTGSGQISGNFTVQSANDLAILLRAGALPAPLTPVEQRTVGPDLGADSVEAGKNAAIIGFVLVIIYMALSYGLFGIFANIALITNIVLIAGALSMLGATLTLPGIAGIVLTIGMAVDASVLIFERMREEIKTGKTPLSAVEAGYQRALGTILDANITTFLAAFILFQLGSGPVRGFSVTLAIGIVTSVFTAFVFNRFLIAMWLKANRPKALPI